MADEDWPSLADELLSLSGTLEECFMEPGHLGKLIVSISCSFSESNEVAVLEK